MLGWWDNIFLSICYVEVCVDADYLLHAPPYGQAWHKAFFFGGSGRRAAAHTRSAFPQNAHGPVGIQLIRGASGVGRLTQLPQRE